MSPFGLVINSFIIASCVVFFAECTPSLFSVTCPNDWSVDPIKESGKSGPTVVHCWDPSAQIPSSCYPSSCVNQPVCNTCTDIETGESVEQVQCTKEYHAGDGSTLQTICVDSKNRFLNCSGTCTGSLTCSQCFYDSYKEKFKTQLHRRANPFSASMGVGTGSGHAGGNYFGDNFNLRT
ncbi:secreted protein [Melampsora americana]|nr:secreted protein [Melampsora americana]